MRKHGWSMLWVAGALALALGAGSGACACKGSGNKGTKGNGNTNKPVVSECDKHRAKVEKLYRAAITETDPKKRAAAEASVPDDVTMIMNDCRTKPAQFGPCLARVNTVKEMEQRCIIQLDDEGKVEGRAFGGS